MKNTLDPVTVALMHMGMASSSGDMIKTLSKMQHALAVTVAAAADKGDESAMRTAIDYSTRLHEISDKLTDFFTIAYTGVRRTPDKALEDAVDFVNKH
jgi:hypothetical protein